MKNMIELSGVSFAYPGMSEDVFKDYSLKISQGEFVLITGPSGCGKSTLLKMFNGLVPKYSGGRFSGKIFVNGVDVRKSSISELSDHVGMVFQDPENQIIMEKVVNEIAFGLENKNVSQSDMQDIVGLTAEKLGISHLLDRKTDELSGGEKQKVVLASIIALKPRILVLDEPTSQIDPVARRQLLEAIVRLNKDDGMTIVLVEHNTSDIINHVDRTIKLGSLKESGIGRVSRKKNKKKDNICINVSGLSKSYGNRIALNDINLKIFKGEFVSIIGSNGSGKTTLIKHFNGLLRPGDGSVTVNGLDTSKASLEELACTIGYLTQNPSDSFFNDTVFEEILTTLKNYKIHRDPYDILKSFGLEGLCDQYPRDLSVGQRQRLALASVTSYDPDILVLDEPTRGIDIVNRDRLIRLFERLNQEGKTIILVTQDESLAKIADRTIVLDDGRLLDE